MVKDGASNTDDISKHDLELLVHANTETQKMFGDVLHAFELFTTQQRGSVQGAKALLTDIKALTQELKDTINTHETRCVMCSDCVVKIKVGVGDLKSSLFNYTCVIIGLSGLLSVIINVLFKYL
jgi:hypothetical protein